MRGRPNNPPGSGPPEPRRDLTFARRKASSMTCCGVFSSGPGPPGRGDTRLESAAARGREGGRGQRRPRRSPPDGLEADARVLLPETRAGASI